MLPFSPKYLDKLEFETQKQMMNLHLLGGEILDSSDLSRPRIRLWVQSLFRLH